MLRRIHEAAAREAQSGNLVPFESRGVLVSLWLRLLLRTSRTAGLLRLGTAAVLIVAALTTNSLVILVICLAVALLLIVNNWRAVLPRKVWENPSVLNVNRLATHSRLGFHESFKEAAQRETSSKVISLNGTWKFRLVGGVAETPAGFETPEFGDRSWEDIDVPGHWQLQDAGASDPPIYTNTVYPFPNRPPYAPRSNPTGLYRRSLTLPSEWFSTSEADADTSDNMDARDAASLPIIKQSTNANSRLKGRVVVIFQGVDSAFHVWLNGKFVGFAKGSRLPCEFDITDALTGSEEQCLCVRVVRWSDGSYLEDQDHWWLSGLYRDVELVLRPTPARISDFVVRSFLDQDSTGNHTKGSLEVEVLVEGDTTPQLSSSTSPDDSTTVFGGKRQAVAAKPPDGSSRASEGEGESWIPLGAVQAMGGESEGDSDAAVSAAGRAADVEITCTLIDTATGEQHLVPFAGKLSDWQMGLSPSIPAPRPRADVHGGRKSGSGDGRRRSTSGDAARMRAESQENVAASTASKSVMLFRLELPEAVRAWSAEDPQLYTLVVGLTRDIEGNGAEPVQFESAKVGFRSVRVMNGQLLVNGRAVMLAGVNRHEHDPDTGKTISEASMRQDIVLMKRFNFNAVRNCHYPNHWRWYELCDELGLYVCDEANIETHGQVPPCRLSDDPAWRTAYLDRCWRMLSANKNHACVVLWSLGNESGDGRNFLACRQLIKEVDPSRPVVYEGGGKLVEGCGCTELTDVVCPMYASVDRTELLGKDGPSGIGETRPCILAEYSHAMGNSNGNLHKYWEIFRKYRRLQGGFIWDWVDQGLTKHDPVSGRRYWADGGGFSDNPHSQGYNLFCLNGITFPDRSPHPALWEAKFLAQPVHVELIDNPLASLTCGDPTHLNSEVVMRLRITNRYDFSALDHLSATWRLWSSAAPTDPLATAPLSLAGMAPGQSREAEIVWDVAKARAEGTEGTGAAALRGELFLDVEVRLGADTSWATAEHMVSWACFEVGGVLPLPATASVEGEESAPTQMDADGGGDDVHPLLPGASLSSVTEEAEGEELERASKAHSSALLPQPSSPPSSSLIVYEDDDETSLSSREGSPMGQLREHLLTDRSVPDRPSSSMVVVKGSLDEAGEGGGGKTRVGEAGKLSAKEWMLAVSKMDGTIQRFVVGGVDLVEPGSGPTLCLWRAATDNDRAGWASLMNFVVDHRIVRALAKFMPLSQLSHLERWKASGVSAREPPEVETLGIRVETSSAKECLITVDSRLKSSQRGFHKSPYMCNVSTTLRVLSSGKLEITTNVEPFAGAFDDCVSYARVGLEMKVPPGFGHVEWLGKGPFECYQDRKSGARTNVFSGTVEEQHVPYINPCENGGKADVRWMALRKGEGGTGVLMRAGAGAPFNAASCSLYNAAELEKARRTVDLPLRSSAADPVYVKLDHRSMGVGGDNSWYPDVVHDEYRVPANKSYRFSVRLEALAPGDVAASIASS